MQTNIMESFLSLKKTADTSLDKMLQAELKACRLANSHREKVRMAKYTNNKSDKRSAELAKQRAEEAVADALRLRSDCWLKFKRICEELFGEEYDETP